MNQTLITITAVASFVLTVDLITTYLRKRGQSKSVTPEPPPTKEEVGSGPEEGVAIE